MDPIDISLWDGVTSAIQVWTWLGTGGLVLQLLFIVFLVFAGVRMTQGFFREMMKKDE